VVVAVGARDEAVVVGVDDAGVEDAVDEQESGLLVELVLDLGAARNLDDRVDERGDVADVEVVPGVRGDAARLGGLVGWFGAAGGGVRVRW
jgi:hypothetical protein